MKNTYGNSICTTVFGESHGEQIGVVLDGMPSGLDIDKEFIYHQLMLRRPAGKISTARREEDKFKIVSGVFNGKTTGTPLCIMIPNSDTRCKDYSDTRSLARPGHADYTAYCKYGGYEDYRGGGHFSGRITAPLVAAGAIAISALSSKGIHIGTHIKKCAGVFDKDFCDLDTEIKELNKKSFAVIDDAAGDKMMGAIIDAANDGDSVGGILETAVTGVPSGVGEPWFDSVESQLSHVLFSVPAVKGVQFGLGFDFADKRGSEANDSMYMDNGKVVTATNNNGGINGGITNGMPVLFSCVIKPTPSIFKSQHTVDFINNKDAELTLKGRHDPAIIHRARVVVDSMTALVLCDMLAMCYGTDWLRGGTIK